MDSKILREVNHRHIHSVDKLYRMHAGLSSKLTDYKDKTIYLSIEVSKRWFKDEITTARQLANDWMRCNKELKDAERYEVTITRIQGTTGFCVSVDMLDNKEMLEKLTSEMNKGSERLVETGTEPSVVVGDFDHSIFVVQSERIKVVFTTLVINAKSIERVFGNIVDFALKTGLRGETNGKIHCVAEMRWPPYELMEFASKELIPLGLQEKKDYVFVDEQYYDCLHGKMPMYMNKEIPRCQNIPWLGSIIRPNGNWVWYKE